MFQLVTQNAGYGLYAQIALGLFFFAFMLILISTLIRPRSQMQHYARMALTEDIKPTPPPGASPGVTPAPGESPGESPGTGSGATSQAALEVSPGASHDPAPTADAEHGAPHHE
jgi:hypothetical protein